MELVYESLLHQECLALINNLVSKIYESSIDHRLTELNARCNIEQLKRSRQLSKTTTYSNSLTKTQFDVLLIDALLNILI